MGYHVELFLKYYFGNKIMNTIPITKAELDVECLALLNYNLFF